MQTVMAIETLKTGEQLRVECVMAPDAAREAEIRPFLAHKSTPYHEHIEAALTGNCDILETRFYIGLLGDEMVGNIMTVEVGGVGILGHVHTRQDQRRKGICDAIMRHQMEDFRQRGGHVLLLGTGYQSAAYRIYESHGFRDWPVGSPGWMRYDTEPIGQFETGFFAPAANSPTPARWGHWPLVALLATIPPAFPLRNLAMNVWGVSMLEGPYCRLLSSIEERPDACAAVLESETGAVVAMTTCLSDSRWPGIRLLDLFAHPDLSSEALTPLLESLPLPNARLQAYADPNDTQKIGALEKAGFQRATVLPNQYHANDAWHDLGLYVRG